MEITIYGVTSVTMQDRKDFESFEWRQLKIVHREGTLFVNLHSRPGTNISAVSPRRPTVGDKVVILKGCALASEADPEAIQDGAVLTITEDDKQAAMPYRINGYWILAKYVALIS